MAKNPARGHNIIAKNVIPDLVGMTRTTAQSLLSSLGFTYTETSESSQNEAENNIVSAQSVTAGNTEILGTNVPYTYKTFSFTPFGFTPFGAFGFTPFGFTPFGFTPVAFSFVTFSFTPFGFTPFGAFGFLNFGFSPSQCIEENVIIKTKSGNKTAKDIQIGDILYTLDLEDIDINNISTFDTKKIKSNGIIEVEVQNIQSAIKDTLVWFNGNDSVKFSQEQPMFVKRDGEYMVIASGLVDINDYLITTTDSGEIKEDIVANVETMTGEFNVYSFSISPKSWYIVENYLVHTK